jgi:cobalt-zinc-cadmium resistance protein CzcA
MVERLVEAALRGRVLVAILTLLVVAVGIAGFRNLSIDAVPDITNVQVQILTRTAPLGPVEVERYVTFPIEAAMSGLPDVAEIRSVSRFGLSAVTVVFKDGVNVYFARQLVSERLPAAREAIPQGFGSPELGPVTTGLGEVYQFVVQGPYSPMELKEILDWQIAYRLRSVPGVTEVSGEGGFTKQYQVIVDPAKLVAYRLSVGQVFRALEANNVVGGGGYIEKGGEAYLVRGEGLVEDADAIAGIVVATSPEGVPVTVRQLGTVQIGSPPRIGAATRDGEGEAVIAMTLMLKGANARAVAKDVKAELERLLPSLPPGVTIEPFYDRAKLVDAVVHTVAKNLIEGGLLVIAVLFLLLGNLRGGLIVASAIPLSMLVAFTGMVAAGISGNLMSLGAIDFGLIVDGAVVMIENIIRRKAGLGLEHRDHVHVVRNAATEVARPIAFAVGIIVMVYVPILTLGGIEGKMFRPMAYTVIFALVGSLVLSLTVVPVLASFFLRGPVAEHETLLLRWARRIYEPVLDRVIARPRATLAAAAGVLATSLALTPFMGSEFVPRLDEGDLTVQAWRLPSIALGESLRSTGQIERVLKRFPEVTSVVSRTGTPDVATDVMGMELSDIFVALKPRDDWTTVRTKEELVEKMAAALGDALPGVGISFTQPIEMRFNELISGVRSDIALKIFGDDLAVLKERGDAAARVLATIPGARDIKVEQVAGLPVLRVKIDRQKIARYGINAEDVVAALEAAGAGRTVGKVFEGQRRFDIAVRVASPEASGAGAYGSLPIAAPDGSLIPLSQLAEIAVEEGPAQVSRERISRRIVVETNVRSRDIGSFVAEAQRELAKQTPLPPGYYYQWGGQFENLRAARARLALAVPAALLLIFLMLFLTFNAAPPALLIFLNVPMAATGGVFALALRGMPFSISAGVGFIALFGVAVLNGVVLMSYVLQMRRDGLGAEDAARRGARIRLRPVLTTALVASLGFVPMALSTSPGAEVQRPLATVVIGGLVTSTALTLLLLPSLYAWLEERRAPRGSTVQSDAAISLGEPRGVEV